MMWDMDIFTEMERLRREMNGLFSNFVPSSDGGGTTYPLMNVYDGKDAVVATAELPGLSKSQVSITYADGILTLAGKQEPMAKAKGMTVIRKERSEGEFEKTLRIPTKIRQEAIGASFNNGILTVTMPKAEEAKPKTIAIAA